MVGAQQLAKGSFVGAAPSGTPRALPQGYGVQCDPGPRGGGGRACARGSPPPIEYVAERPFKGTWHQSSGASHFGGGGGVHIAASTTAPLVPLSRPRSGPGLCIGAVSPNKPPTGCHGVVRLEVDAEERGRGRGEGFGTQKFVYQKWPDQIFQWYISVVYTMVTLVGGFGPRDASEGTGPQRPPQKRLGRRLEEVTKAVGGGYCRLQMPLRLALGVRGTVAGHGLSALEGGGGGTCPPSNASLRGGGVGGQGHHPPSSDGVRPF